MKYPGFTEDQERNIGLAVINLLGLKYTKEYPDRVNTVHGTKTALGLGRTVISEMEKIEENKS
jgi:hypothetical protein